MLGKPGKTVRRARKLRSEMTFPEVALWAVLRARPDNLKFRRQHPAGPYAIDFYCAEARLAIEIDGEIHGRGDTPARDLARDARLAADGIQTLRVPAVEVIRDLDAVVRGIVAAARARLPLHRPAAPGGPPPQAELGED
jgi:very-short-patch-repair endonuclease